MPEIPSPFLVFSEEKRQTKHLVFGLATTPEPCPPDWVPQKADEIFFHIIGNPDWKETSGDKIVFNFDCPEVQDCPTEWFEQDPKNLILDFRCCGKDCIGTWVPQDHENLLLDHVCCNDEELPEIILPTYLFFDGQDFLPELDTFPIFQVSGFYDGSTLTLDLQTPKPVAFNIEFPHGETLDVIVNVDSRLNPNEFEHGEFVRTKLEYSPAIVFPRLDFYHGETSEVKGEFQTLFAVEFPHGEISSSELKDEPAEGIRAEFPHGETLDIKLERDLGFALPFYHGENSEVSIKTEINFEQEFQYGENLDVVLDANIPAAFNIEFPHGEVSEILLNIDGMNFPVMFFYHGEESALQFEPRPAENFPINISDGSSLELKTISTSEKLPQYNFHHGENSTIEITSTEFIDFYHGETSETSLATSATLSDEFSHGETLELEIKFGPSEPINKEPLIFSHGEHVTGELDTLVQVTFEIVAPTTWEMEIGIPADKRYIDLNNTCCYPQVHYGNDEGRLNIEMTDVPDDGEHFAGDRIRFECELSIRPRFEMDFYDGTNFRTVEQNTKTIDPVFYDGNFSTVALESIYNFRLCRGNFIPEGDAVYIELDALPDDDCEAIWFHDGTSMHCDLSYTKSLEFDFYHGETSFFDLDVPQRWFFQFAHGEHLFYPSEAEFDPNIGHGETMECQLYIEPIEFPHGEFMETKLVIQYEVKLKEQGCLDNEYIPLDEHGDPDWSKFQNVPIEGDQYQHDIKAECY